jgi:cellulose synthase/poly-beta-1,6-N-acetylglucosamine synthase-like glycosyltransferase
MELLFWLASAFVLYVYVGYPALLAIAVRVRTRLLGRRLAGLRQPGSHRSVHQATGAGHHLPAVSVVIAVRDEAQRLPGRIQNLLDAAYPQDRLEIIVASDGSTDDTADAIAPFADRVRFLALPRAGKASALNAAVAQARHPIVVFADARQRFAPDAIRRLVTHFRDPQVGAVSGELVLDCEERLARPAADGAAADSTVADGVGAYWKYEKWLRRHEAVVDSTVGVTGAIYAMRRWLWQPLPLDTLLDDVLTPMRIVLRGYRVIFEAGAVAFDGVSKDTAGEMKRKVRTLAGNFQLLAREPRLLLPGVNPVWLQFVSHKIGRLFVPHALLAVLIASLVLAPTSRFYAAALAAQLVFYGLAAYGALLERRTQRPVTGEVFREAA